MGVGRVPVTHFLNRAGERMATVEYVGVFSEATEDSPREKMAHLRTALGSAPIGIVLQQLDVELVDPTRRADVERAFAQLLAVGDPVKRQEVAETIGEPG